MNSTLMAHKSNENDYTGNNNEISDKSNKLTFTRATFPALPRGMYTKKMLTFVSLLDVSKMNDKKQSNVTS